MYTMYRYNVTAEIISGIDETAVWQGTVEKVAARNPEAAAAAARTFIEENVAEYDARIQPSIRIIETAAITQDAEELSRDLVAAAEQHAADAGESDRAIGDLEEALGICIAALGDQLRPELIRELNDRGLLGSPTIKQDA